MHAGPVAAVYRIGVGSLALVAVGYQLLFHHLPDGFDPVNFFSYFTNLSNILLGAVFIITAIRLLQGRWPTRLEEAIRGGAVLYIVFVGLVFGALLQDVPVGNLQPWVNTVVHYITPVAAILDWFLWPPRRRLSFEVALVWLLWPAAYTGYTLIRGAITGFYPYPFFDPSGLGGYAGVALTCGVMLLVLLLLGVVICLARQRRPGPLPASHRVGVRRAAGRRPDADATT